jgi:hypothetical protein
MLYGIAGFASFMAALYSWLRYVGPYRWAAEMQQNLWGADLVHLSLFVTWIGLYLPLHWLVGRIEMRFGVVREPASWTRLVALVNFFFDQRPGQLTAAGLLTFSTGSAILLRDSLPSRHLRITGGTLATDHELQLATDGTTARYIPIVSDPTSPIPYRAFIRLGAFTRRGETAEYQGAVDANGLPGPLEAILRDRKMLAADYFVVWDGTDPVKQQTSSREIALFGALMFAAGLLWTYQRKRNAARV